MKQEFDIVKLVPKTPFHLGEHGIGLEETTTFIHSDTLVSAIISTWDKLYGDIDLKQYFAASDAKDAPADYSPPFVISSAFPYAGDCYFFPRPLMRPKTDDTGDVPENIRKLLKKAGFISKSVFEAYIAGKTPEPPREETGKKPGNLIQKNKFQVTMEEKAELKKRMANSELPLRLSASLRDGEIIVFKEQEVPRVTPDRITSASNIFYFARILFAEDCGYFFLVKYFGENIKAKFRAVLRLLGEQGISGDRSSGHGRFEPEFHKQKLTFNVPDDADHFISLSLLYPKKCELANGLLNGEAAYNFITRDGWFFSRMSYKSKIKRRQKRRMFAEGSVFHVTPDPQYYGQITDVRPPDFSEHPVFRWGIGFPIGVKL